MTNEEELKLFQEWKRLEEEKSRIRRRQREIEDIIKI